MSSPLITCIIPAFNAEAFLAEAIDSIVGQSYGGTEIIVVDDGSTDTTGAIIAGYGARVVGLRQENAGPAAALNAGIRSARGELVAFLDADDLWDRDKLARQLSRIEAKPGIEITYGLAQNFWSSDLAVPAEPLRERLAKPFPAPALTMLARRELFPRVGLFNQARPHGYTTEWLVLAREHGVAIDQFDTVLAQRRLHPGNRSRQHAGRSRDEFLHLMKEHLNRRRSKE